MTRTCPRRLAPLCAALALAGCYGTGATVGPGSVPNSWTFGGTPQPVMPQSGMVGPPPSLLNGQGAPGPAGPVASGPAASGPPQQGRYVGEATVIANPLDLTCDNTKITDFEVRGDHVSLGGFLGTIRPDGSVELQAGLRYIFGRFNGSHFVGQMNNSPGCSYAISLFPA